MGLVSAHTWTENDSIKEALKSGFLSVNYITITWDGQQPGSLIGMRMLAIIQHLDLTEQRHEGGSTQTENEEITVTGHCGTPLWTTLQTTLHCACPHIVVVQWSIKVTETTALSGHSCLRKKENRLGLQGLAQVQ